MIKQSNYVLSKSSQMGWPGRVTDFELLCKMSSLSCNAGEFLFKREYV